MLWKDKKSSLRLDIAVSECPCTRMNELIVCSELNAEKKTKIPIYNRQVWARLTVISQRDIKKESQEILYKE